MRVRGIVERWREFASSALGARLVPVYAVLTGGALGALVADQFVRSMWRHAIFTGPYQWRTTALVLTALWIAIGVVAALALLGPPASDEPADDHG